MELLSRLSHPGIPRLLDPGGPRPLAGAEYPFFVMEWVQGTPSSLRRKPQPTSSPPEAR